MTQSRKKIISRLRNRNVAQLLDSIDNPTEKTILLVKRQFTRFSNDLEREIQENEQETQQEAKQY